MRQISAVLLVAPALVDLRGDSDLHHHSQNVLLGSRVVQYQNIQGFLGGKNLVKIRICLHTYTVNVLDPLL